MAEPLLKFSPLESQRFAKVVYRGVITQLSDAQKIVRTKPHPDVDLLIVRTPTAQLQIAQLLEAHGFFLCDTLVRYRGQTQPKPSDAPSMFQIREATTKDAETLGQLARACFQNFLGHYHADPKLDAQAATEGYVELAQSALNTPDQWAVLATRQAEALGFLTVARRAHKDGHKAEVILNGVHPKAQGQGLYTQLWQHIQAQCHQMGLDTIEVATQLTNLGPQKVWTRHGLALFDSSYTFHKWYDAHSV